MKVDIEAIWIYALTVLLSAYMYLNFTGMRSQVIFYFMVSTGSVLTIISLGRKEPYVDPRKIGEALMYTVLNMWAWALLFQILTKFGIGMVTLPLPTEIRQMLLNTGVPLMYFFLVGAGETLFYVGIPLSLSRSLRHYGKVSICTRDRTSHYNGSNVCDDAHKGIPINVLTPAAIYGRTHQYIYCNLEEEH